MSSDPADRLRLLRDLALAGRMHSDAAVMYHTALAERVGMGPSDWKTLSILEREGPLTAGGLSDRSGLAPASITGILDRLERAGWVHRTRDPTDRRRVIVSLDPEATAEKYGFLFTGLRRRLDEIYEGYTDQELELLREALEQLAGALREAAREHRPGHQRDDVGRDVAGASRP
jgi:DNA-binding MarR family transcriptional regulator